MREKKRAPVLLNADDGTGLAADLEAISESFRVLADTGAPAKTYSDRSRHLEKTWSLTAQ